MTTRVLLVDDSATARRILRTHLERDPRFQVVGEACDGREGLEMMARLKPDVVSLDLHMPGMDGFGFLESKGPHGPPTVVVSSEAVVGTPTARRVRSLGAASMVAKCTAATPDCMRTMLVEYSRALLRVSKGSPAASVPHSAVPISMATGRPAARDGGLIAIGSSTGGVEALEQVLRGLPADCPPVVVSQHMPPGFTSNMANRFDDICAVRVREATDGAVLEAGLVLIAPGNRHLRVGRGMRIILGDDAKVNGHRPSVCVMFRSIAKLGVVGVRAALLTGMGRDGAAGMLELRRSGAFTVAQDEATSVVYGMPKVAAEIGAADQVMPLQAISSALMRPTPARRPRAVRA